MTDYPWWAPKYIGDPAVPRKRLFLKLKTYGFVKTVKWLAFDFLNAITFGWIKSRPISEESPPSLQQTNEPTDNKNKKIINVEDPEEDNDVVNKKYLESGKFTGTFTEHTLKTVTVVKGLITSVA